MNAAVPRQPLSAAATVAALTAIGRELEAKREHALEVGAIRMVPIRVYGPSVRSTMLKAIAEAEDVAEAQALLFKAASTVTCSRTMRLLRAAVERKAAEARKARLVAA